MKLCPTCALQMWNYNHETYTCKNGHLWSHEMKAQGDHEPVVLKAAKPQPTWPTPSPSRWPLVAASGLSAALGALIVEVVSHL